MQKQKNLSFQRQHLGWLAVFGSAFCFYLATLVIRWAAEEVTIPTSTFVLARFVLGFGVVCCTMVLRGERPRPCRYHFLFGRTIANTVAVFCFYQAVETTSVAEANILNMTYPLFVALAGWFLLRKQRDLLSLPIVGMAFFGVWLVLAPSDISSFHQSLWGLASGMTAAAAILYLNVSRRYHDSQTILFFMFGCGGLVIGLLFPESLSMVGWKEFGFLLACSVAGVAGQYLLTFGFLYVTAVEGSIISSTRILLAALLGPLLAAEPSLTMSGWIGALLIFVANCLLAFRRQKLRERETAMVPGCD